MIPRKLMRFLPLPALVILASLAPPGADAAMSSQVRVLGKVESFDQNIVKLKTRKGTLTKVPRSSIPNSDRLRPGQTVTAELPFRQLMQMNPKKMGAKARNPASSQ